MPRMLISRRHIVKSKYHSVSFLVQTARRSHAIQGRYDCTLTRVATQSSSKKSRMRTCLVFPYVRNPSECGLAATRSLPIPTSARCESEK